MDTNHDGVISKYEFEHGVLQYINMPKNDIRKLFCYFDKQNLGLITKKNFTMIILNHQLRKPTDFIEQDFNIQFDILRKFNYWASTS